MNFGQLHVKTKIRLPVWILIIFTMCVTGYGLISVQSTIKQGHIEKVQALVESGRGIARENYSLFKSGELTEDQAKKKAKDAIRAMVFNGGARVFAFDEQGVRVVSNHVYSEGTSAWDAPQTKSMIRKALKGGGVTYYRGLRTLNGVDTGSVPKAAWSEHFEPWGWVIASAVYLDDVEEAFWKSLIELVLFLGSSGLLIFTLTNAIIKSITEPLAALTKNMKSLASGNTNILISSTDRTDEIGEMAIAMETFVAHETQRYALQDQLKTLAYTDTLTGLANRAMFYDTLRAAIKSGLHSGKKCALMILDLDRFKTINDTLGHEAGDAILVEMARRLVDVVGAHGHVGRLSGDEFFIILEDLDHIEVAKSIAQLALGKAEEAIEKNGNQIHITASIGLAIGPDDSSCESKLYRFADMALLAAKTSGGASALYYSPEMGQLVEKGYELESMIQEGLREEQFKAHFQAKIDLAAKKINSAEALCRWYHPERGLISPAEFIPVAEKTGQIYEIGQLMLKQACEFAVKCNRLSDEPFVVAVNVSGKQLLYGRFLATLGKCLEETGCCASWIELELTESLLLSDTDAMVELLERITSLGVSLAIDDFGTGYSAMSYLCRFPIKCLKVDQSFVRDMDTDPKKQVLVRSILAMANGLGLKTVAEGVETDEIAKTLTELKCDVGQGYLWHRPSTPEELLSKLEYAEAA